MNRITLITLISVILLLMLGCPSPTSTDEPGTINVDLTSLSFSTTGTMTVETDETPTLSVTVVPSNATTTLTWSSSDTSVATVADNGKITAVSEGTTTITVESSIDPSINSTCTIIIIKDGARPDMSNFVLYNQTEDLVGETTSILPEFINGRMVIVSDDPNAKINSGGPQGVTFVYYNQAMEGDFTVRARILVSAPLVISTSKGVALGAYTLSNSKELKSTSLFSTMMVRTSSGGDRNGYNTKTDGSIGTSSPKESGSDVPMSVERIYQVKRDSTGITLSVYSSDSDFSGSPAPLSEELIGYADNSDASTTLNSGITATSPMYLGLTVFGATAEVSNFEIVTAGTSIYSSYKIDARDVMVSKISLNSNDYLRNEIENSIGGYSTHYQNTLTAAQSDTIDLNASIIPDFAKNTTVTWGSSNTSVVTVNADGILTFTGAGDAVITATSNDGTDFQDSYYISITSGIVPVKSIVISGEANVMKYLSTSLVADILPLNASDQSVLWSSSNDAIATIDSTTGSITGVTAGEVTITATANDGSGISNNYTMAVIASAGELLWNFQTLPTGWNDDEKNGNSTNGVTDDTEYLSGMILNTSDEEMKFRTIEANRPAPDGTDWSFAYFNPSGSGDHLIIPDISGDFTISLHYTTASSSGSNRAATIQIDSEDKIAGEASAAYDQSRTLTYTHKDTGSPVIITVGSDAGIRLYDVILTLSSAQ